MTSPSRRSFTRSSIFPALLGLLFLAAGAAVWFLLPPSKSTARMRLHIAPTQPRLLFTENENADVPYDIFLRNQAIRIRDRFTLMAVLRNPQIAKLPTIEEQPDPVQWLESNLLIEFPSSEFMQISLSGDRPEDTLKIVAAVTHTYMNNYVNKEIEEHESQRKKLKALHDNVGYRLERCRRELKARREQAGGVNENRKPLEQRLALQELHSIETELAQARQELRRLRLELSLHPDWIDEVWPRYAAALNCQLGPGLPVNHAIVALLHDDVHLLRQTAPGDRPQKKERLRFLAAIEKTLLREAVDLDARIQERLRIDVDLGELQEDIKQQKKVLYRIDEKLFKLDVEEQAPPRITLTSREPILIVPDATKRKMMAGAAATLAGLGILLFGLAGIKFRRSKTN